MNYKEKPQLHLYEYKNNSFSQTSIIDDYQEISFEHNLYEAGNFTITINYNIPNALKFERGMFVQFGNNPYMFGEILRINDSIGEDGKGSQIRSITGKDARFLFKRRIIKNLNNEENWIMTDKGEICIRNLVKDQCGTNAETKRQLPITNTIPASADAVGKEYSVSESYTNLYDTLVTIATQSETGWRIKFDGSMTLECYEGNDISNQVQFSTEFDSLSSGQFSDSSESYANSIYIGGKGIGAERDIYEGENSIEGASPSGLDRYEAWDNQSEMTSESEYEAEALSMLAQYGQTVTVSGKGLVQCPYIFQEQYDIGDVITIAFSGKSAKAQILAVTEHWTWGRYSLEFSFGKPQNDLARQLQLILKQIQKASSKTTVTASVKWYTMTSDTVQDKSDVIYDTIGFTGAMTSNKTFTFYLDDEKTGAKSYNVYCKNLSGNYTLTLTTGVSGATNFTIKGGINIVARILVDENGNIVSQSMTATDTIESGNNQPVTSGAVGDSKYNFIYEKNLNSAGWYKICTLSRRNRAFSLSLDLNRAYFSEYGESHKIQLDYSWLKASCSEIASCERQLFTKIRICYNDNDSDVMSIYVYYNSTLLNTAYYNITSCESGIFTPYNFETDSITWDNSIEFNLGDNGLFQDGKNVMPVDSVTGGNMRAVTSNAVAESLQAGNFLSGGIKLYTRFSKEIPLATWTDLITPDDIPSGTYLFVLKINDDVQFWNEYLTFVMYYFAEITNDSHSSQIYFNQSGHAPNNATVHLLYQRRYSSDTGRGTIRIYIDYGASIIPVQVSIFKLTENF